MKKRWLWAATLLLVAAATTFSATRINLATQVRGILGETNGGTAQSTYALGDTLYSDAADSLAKLSGNITTTKKFLSQTGTGSVSAAPSWGDVLDADIPSTIARDSELHGQSHVLADTVGLGVDHTTSGLTARQVLIATGATTALFRALVDADIPNTITLDNITQITTRPITSLTGVATKSQLPLSVAYEDEANTFTQSQIIQGTLTVEGLSAFRISDGTNVANFIKRTATYNSGFGAEIGPGAGLAVGGGEAAEQVAANVVLEGTETLFLVADPTGGAEAIRFITGLQAGWASRVDAMVIRGDGNVGIGTASPGRTLHVVTSFDVVARFESTDSFSSISIRDSNTTAGDQVLIAAVADAMRFRTLNQDRMTILSGGNVGIGTTSPNEPLEVAAASGLTQFSLKRTNTNMVGTIGSVVFTNSADAILAEIRALGSGTNTDADIVFLTKTSAGGLTEQMRILDSGNVGIGVTNPDRKLKVRASADNVTVFSIVNSANTAEIFAMFSDASGDGIARVADSGNSIRVQLNSAGDSYFTGGDVGFGINNPSANLHVVGDFKIGTSGTGITRHLSNTATIDFGAVGANTCLASNITVTNAVVNDVVALGVPNTAVTGLNDIVYWAYVVSSNTVAVRACNLANVSVNPGSGTFRVDVWQHS